MNATTKPGFPQQKPIGPWASKPLMLQALPPQCFAVLIRPGNSGNHIMKRLQQLLKQCLLPSPLSLGRLWGGTPKLYSEVPTFSYKRTNRCSKSFDGLSMSTSKCLGSQTVRGTPSGHWKLNKSSSWHCRVYLVKVYIVSLVSAL